MPHRLGGPQAMLLCVPKNVPSRAGFGAQNPLETVQGLGAHPSTLKMALEGLEGLTEPSQALARLSHAASVPELVLPRHTTPHWGYQGWGSP